MTAVPLIAGNRYVGNACGGHTSSSAYLSDCIGPASPFSAAVDQISAALFEAVHKRRVDGRSSGAGTPAQQGRALQYELQYRPRSLYRVHKLPCLWRLRL